ncbi:MAG: hypothetical protein D6767_05605 [Candidatus Hydrogenedentota bacterium]|nr:MAG: hypothetical protein D6767_05605 [Candidatus Hydrogenedentota bacterium]
MAYRIYFPLAFITGFVGILLWIHPPKNAIFYHRELMVTGFLLSAAFGFLLTAVPRFLTSLEIPKPLFMALFISHLFAITGIFLSPVFYYTMLILTLVLFLLYLWDATKKRQGFIPFFMPYVFWGFSAATLSILLRLAGEFHYVSLTIAESARVVYHHGLFLLLVLGIGQKLGVMLLGTAPNAKTVKYFMSLHWPHIYSFIFIMSYFFQNPQTAYITSTIRAVLVTWILIGGWNIFSKSQNPLAVSLWIRALAITALLSVWTEAFFPVYMAHISHGVLAGIVGLFALMIMSRVLYGHEGLPNDLEKNVWYAHIIWGTLFLGLWTRSTAFLLKSYMIHLQMASILWCFGLMAITLSYFLGFRKAPP